MKIGLRFSLISAAAAWLTCLAFAQAPQTLTLKDAETIALANHPGIQAWLAEAALPNVLPPIVLDVNGSWPKQAYDGVFTANTLHIVSWESAQKLIAGAASVLKQGGRLVIYGPFNYHGSFTSDSNARFDEWLKNRDPASGIRDFEAVGQCAESHGLRLETDHAMPANNRLLIFIKT